jgi:hypothetical protein
MGEEHRGERGGLTGGLRILVGESGDRLGMGGEIIGEEEDSSVG